MSHVETKSGVPRASTFTAGARRASKCSGCSLRSPPVGIASCGPRDVGGVCGCTWTRDSRSAPMSSQWRQRYQGVLWRCQCRQSVRAQGRVLMVIDPTDYRIALDLAEAGVLQARLVRPKLHRPRRNAGAKLSDLAVTVEDRQTTRRSHWQPMRSIDRQLPNLIGRRSIWSVQRSTRR